MNQLITVVIPNYNGMKYLKGCLDSLLQGTVIPKIIVVDNGSTDGSCELIRREYERDLEPREAPVTLLALKSNTGFCHAVNAGIHLTVTPYVVLLNNDITVDAHCIENLHRTIVSHPRAFSVQAKMLSMQDPDVIDDAGDLYCALGWGFAIGKGKKAERYSREREIFSACAGAAIYRMSAFEEIGLFDERHFCYLEDVDIGYRAQIYGYRNYFAPEALVYHAGSATSGSRYNPFKEEMTPGNNACVLYKNMPAFQYAFNWPLIRLGIAVKRAYFRKKGLSAAYESGIVRGEVLRQRIRELTYDRKYGFSYPKQNLKEECCLQEHDELDTVYPMYLAGKVPFRLRHLPNYLRIQGLLWINTVRRLTK